MIINIKTICILNVNCKFSAIPPVILARNLSTSVVAMVNWWRHDWRTCGAPRRRTQTYRERHRERYQSKQCLLIFLLAPVCARRPAKPTSYLWYIH